MLFDKSQLMRGTLEGCILKLINDQTTYGYEIIEHLKQSGFDDISEGTIYPILLRLERQGAIEAELRPSPLGPKRKYFTITTAGKTYLQSFVTYWEQLHGSVDDILLGGGAHETH
ncbi:MAG: PadR family transcriptional regulator [Eubacteriales bacterium]